jgi:hypothetical protein
MFEDAFRRFREGTNPEVRRALGLFLRVLIINENSDATCTSPCFHILPPVSYHETGGKVHPVPGCGLVEEARLGFAAGTVVPIIVVAYHNFFKR